MTAKDVFHIREIANNLQHASVQSSSMRRSVVISLAKGAKAAMVPQISSISCRFVRREAVSQTQYCCSLKVKIFANSFEPNGMSYK